MGDSNRAVAAPTGEIRGRVCHILSAKRRPSRVLKSFVERAIGIDMSARSSAVGGAATPLPLHLSIIKQRLVDPRTSPVGRVVYGQLCDAVVRGESGWHCEADICRHVCPSPVGTMYHWLRELASKSLIGRRRDRATRRIVYELPLLPRSARGRFFPHYFTLYAAGLADLVAQ
jgi:hypothetical protein